jgi:hypothetical protein
MFGFKLNSLKLNGKPAPADKPEVYGGGFRRTFAKYYMPFRTVVIFSGTIPGVFIAWPLVILIAYFSPDFVVDALGVGINWFVNEALMGGHASEYPRLSFWITVLLPCFFAYALILIENLLYPFVTKEARNES